MRAPVLCLVALLLILPGCDELGGAGGDAGSARIEMQENLAVAHLRSIAAAETQAQSLAVVDADEDGIGEFLFLAELGGARKPRGPGGGLKFPILGEKYKTLGSGGFVELDGYLYRVFLPGDGPIPASEGAGASEAVSADGAEREWLVYAWPVRYGTTGKRTFAMDSSGAIVAADVPAHSGSGAPASGAALVDGEGLGRGFSEEYAKVD
jgi:hypothetical protein